jgi:sugar phosphate permease
VLSYATLAEYFPKELAGRANGALNLFHIAAAFIVQYATGVVLQHWTPQAGHYPEIAYRTAFALNLALQIAAWVWFALPRVQILLRGAKAHAIQRSRPDPDGLLRSIHHNEIA